MANPTQQSGDPIHQTIATAAYALDDMEAELQQLRGLLIVLTHLGEAQDAVEPTALGSLSRSTMVSVDALEAQWRMAMSALRPEMIESTA